MVQSWKMNMPTGFAPISLDEYVELHVRANPGTNRADLIAQLEYAIGAYQRDARCGCGAPIWIIGSAQAGLACFTSITGEAAPDDDYKITIEPKGAG
jgi:hypothetical protein